MKKTTKLLSVLLAVVMMMSCFTMAAFAAKATYQTSANLTSLGAYSPDGAATRFSTEERMSILFDYLDMVLYDVNFEGIHINQSVLFWTITLDVSINSVDEICASLDSIKNLLEGTVASIGSTLNLIGQADQASFASWTKNARRANTDQLVLIQRVLNVLKDNQGLVDTILNDKKIDLGMINGYVSLVSINKIIADIPTFILSKIYPLMQRKDDTKTEAENMFNGVGFSSTINTPQLVLNKFVNNLFNKTQSTTTYKEDATGACISGHTLPTSASQNLRYYYVKSGSGDNSKFTCYVYDPEKQAYKAETDTFDRVEESEGVYTYKNAAGDGLKYYKDGSYWLPSFVGQSININSDSALQLLYKFAPYVFADLAPIAVNGWLKQVIATWMGATETKIYEGKAGTAEASAVLATLPADAQTMFTATIPYYQFSYSNYEAMDNGDTQYYRYVDKDTNVEEWFEIDMTTGNEFLKLFNLDYKVMGDFLDEFIPDGAGSTSDTIFKNLNDFIIKVAQTALKPTEFAKLSLQSGNENFVANIRNAAQVFFPVQPDAVLGPDYLHHYDGYYQTLISTSATDDEVFASLAAIIAKALMPQLILPSADKLYNVGATLVCVVRELVTQFVPTYNYDALIFSNYNTRTILTDKTNSYWLDVILTMGVDVGMTYLSRLTDLGADDSTGFTVDASKTYDLSTFTSNPQAWEAKVDWIVDWALTTSKEWAWNMQNLLDVSGLTINMSSAQDPWTKLNKIITDLLPLTSFINCTAADGQTWLETVLRNKLILGIADLDFGAIFGDGNQDGILTPASGSVLRSTNVLKQIFVIVRDLLNKVIYKIAGNTNLFATGTFTELNTLAGKNSSGVTNLKLPIDVLLSKLPTAYSNGLLQTVLPIVGMFVGWKTSSQELSDPKVSWSNSYVYCPSTSDKTTFTFTNWSSGMLLKRIDANGNATYEKPYNLIIDSISGTNNMKFTMQSGYSTTIAPYGRAVYDVTVTSVPSSDTGASYQVKYHYVGKDGNTVGGYQYMNGYIVLSKNDSLVGTFKDNYKKQSGLINKTDQVNVDVVYTINYLVMSKEDIDTALSEGINYTFTNNCEKNCTISTLVHNSQNTTYFKISPEVAAAKTTLVAGDSRIVHPITYATNKSAEDFTTGTSYAIGKVYFTATQGSYSAGTSSSNAVDLQNLYVADMPDLRDLYNAEVGANRVAGDYNTASLFTAYQTAMKNAAVLMTAPVTSSTFASRYSASNITSVTNALQTAVDNLEEDKIQSAGNVGILENGLTAGEVSAYIGADDQINFQDFDLYGYWAYENVRTEARNIIKEYEGPVEPKPYIEGCWLPYENGDKNEDLTHVLAAESNQTKVDAIEDSMTAPAAKDVEAYNIALSEFKYPEYSELYCSDIAAKLDFFNNFLVPRAYSTEATGRAQLAQEIAYANAQNYNSADYTARSWARYQTALANAQALNGRGSGAMQSYIFEAKYELLKAQRDLRLAAYDWETQNGYDALQALVDLAEGMFANASYFDAVDGTLDTEWTDLIEALGYTAEFGTGNDAWSMNLYEKSATEFIAEEIDTRSGRNEDRYNAVVDALQAAINALKCTIEVVKQDDTNTNVDQDIKYITNINPLALVSGASAVLNYVKASSPAATLTVTGLNNNTLFGTGTTVAVTLNGFPVASYCIVIYGDINGDDAVDGFDAAKADAKLSNSVSFNAAQEMAADATKDGSFGVADVAEIISAASGNTTINQA